jgi:rhodanese-related sulfurtransferase
MICIRYGNCELPIRTSSIAIPIARLYLKSQTFDCRLHKLDIFLMSLELSTVHELSWSQMYNRVNSDPMLLDFRSAAEFSAGHFANCERIDLDLSDQELNAVVKDQIESMKDSNNHCIMIVSLSDWDAHKNRILAALSMSERFRNYHRCHCIHDTFMFAPFLASEEMAVGVPSLIECLLPARVFLSGIFHASKFMADQLHFGRVINVTPDVPRLVDITTSFPIVDSPNVDINPVLEKTRPIIAACVRDNVPILVHCHAGVSRSASAVIDYVASSFQISAHEAMARVKQSRKIVDPNPGFLAQLEKLHP